MTGGRLRVAHVNLSVDDVDAAVRFYGELLGLPPAPRPADAGRAGAWFRCGDVEVHVSLEAGAREANDTSKRHVAFAVGDAAEVDAVRARFVAAGIAIEEARPIEGVVRFFVRDPARNRIEITDDAGG